MIINLFLYLVEQLEKQLENDPTVRERDPLPKRLISFIFNVYVEEY
jgi:hypothetical protein